MHPYVKDDENREMHLIENKTMKALYPPFILESHHIYGMNGTLKKKTCTLISLHML